MKQLAGASVSGPLAFERECVGVCLAFPTALGLLRRRLRLDFFTGAYKAILRALAGALERRYEGDLLGAVWAELVARGWNATHDVRAADLRRLAAFGVEHGSAFAVDALADGLLDARERALVESLAATLQAVARDPAANVRVEARRLAAEYVERTEPHGMVALDAECGGGA
jgi:hypothetical protein